MREESIKAYETIKDNGLLSKRRFQFYEIVYENGPVTITRALEIASRTIQSNNIGSHSGRFSELEEMGVIESVGTMTCPKSGHQVNIWMTTDQLPTKIVKKKSEVNRLREENKRLKEQIEKLQGFPLLFVE